MIIMSISNTHLLGKNVTDNTCDEPTTLIGTLSKSTYKNVIVIMKPFHQTLRIFPVARHTVKQSAMDALSMNPNQNDINKNLLGP